MGLEATERGIGLELIQREAALIMNAEINDELDRQQELWNPRDLEFAQAMGIDNDYTEIEHIRPENIHPGHRPSLVEKLPEPNYPNLSLMAYLGRPSPSPIDQASNFTVTLDTEVMVKGENELDVDRRIHRTTEAVHQVFTRNPKLNGVSRGWDDDPVVNITDIFKRREDKGHGKDFYWQMSRIRYTLTRHNRLPGFE